MLEDGWVPVPGAALKTPCVREERGQPIPRCVSGTLKGTGMSFEDIKSTGVALGLRECPAM